MRLVTRAKRRIRRPHLHRQCLCLAVKDGLAAGAGVGTSSAVENIGPPAVRIFLPTKSLACLSRRSGFRKGGGGLRLSGLHAPHRRCALDGALEKTNLLNQPRRELVDWRERRCGEQGRRQTPFTSVFEPHVPCHVGAGKRSVLLRSALRMPARGPRRGLCAMSIIMHHA
jgi:hypothetical protein